MYAKIHSQTADETDFRVSTEWTQCDHSDPHSRSGTEQFPFRSKTRKALLPQQHRVKAEERWETTSPNVQYKHSQVEIAIISNKDDTVY